MYNFNYEHRNDILNTLSKLDGAASKIENRDYTFWDNVVRQDRLGWVDSPVAMLKQSKRFNAIQNHIRSLQYDFIVLIGMGGSNVGAKTIYDMIGYQEGFPELLILDSTVPDNISDIAKYIDSKKTLFIISSKSGTTSETRSLYRYFRNIYNDERDFVAITDKNTKLEQLALKENFGHVFINDSNIGGRYSVLSYFGLAPSSIVGIDIEKLIKNTLPMVDKCRINMPRKNPGILLGSILGTMVRLNRNKCFIWCTEKTYPLAKWIQQLLSESTGKNGTGVVPLIHVMHNDNYYFLDRKDSFHVVLKYNYEFADEIVHDIQKCEEPTIYIDLDNSYDIGAEFYRWEYAVAIAGHVMKINPFDEPDVLSSKIQTNKILSDYCNDNQLPVIELCNIEDIKDQLSLKDPNDYLAINAYLHCTEKIKESLDLLKRHIEYKYRIPTEIEFGPQYLHSTGQLHKGGIDDVIVLQLSQAYNASVGIPGRSYGFDVFSYSQLAGDVLSLNQLNKRVMVYDLGNTVADNIDALVDQL